MGAVLVVINPIFGEESDPVALAPFGNCLTIKGDCQGHGPLPLLPAAALGVNISVSVGLRIAVKGIDHEGVIRLHTAHFFQQIAHRHPPVNPLAAVIVKPVLEA